MQFFLVYIKEAHALDSRSPSTFAGKDGKLIEDPINFTERQKVCNTCIEDLNMPMPAIVDKIDDAVNKAYSAQPDRLFLVGRDGKIAYAGGRGPFGFRADELGAAIQKELAKTKSKSAEVGDGKIR